MIKYATLQAAQEGKVAPWDLKVDELSDFHVTVFHDRFPVTEGHTLFIPKRHALDYFELSQAEINAINQLMNHQKVLLRHSDRTIEGFNIGMNCGEAAGQTIFHCHVHLIPRRKGDVENPRGGVRHIIAGKGFY